MRGGKRIKTGKTYKFNCVVCLKEVADFPCWNGKRKFCSKKCMGENQRGKNNPVWNGGINRSLGYVQILKPDHPNANKKGYVFEHRLVMSNKLGRALSGDEIVHHINQNINDNAVENLELHTRSSHMLLHSRLRKAAK